MPATANFPVPQGVEQTGPTTMRVERLLKAPIEKVWAYLTEFEKRAKWFAGGTWDLQAGGKTELRFDHDQLSDEPSPAGWTKKGMISHGEITAFDPPRLLAWRDDRIGEGGSHIRMELTPQGGDTLLVITHELPLRKDRVGVAGGWSAHLNILEDALAGRKPRGFWSMHDVFRAHFDGVLPQ